MNKEIKSLLNNLAKELKPIEKSIFTFVVHGSSVYSDELSKFQDIDLYLALDNIKIKELKKLKIILQNFCKKNSNESVDVKYSMAGNGRGMLNKIDSDKKTFLLEIYPASKMDFEFAYKYSRKFFGDLCKNSKVLLGKSLKEYVKYVGDNEHVFTFLEEFDRFQWFYASILEKDYDKEVVFISAQDMVFGTLRNFSQFFGNKISKKEKLFSEFRKFFPKEYKNFKKLFEATIKLRKGDPPNVSMDFYVKSCMKFEELFKEKVYEKFAKA